MRPALIPSERFGDADTISVLIRQTRDAKYIRRLSAVRYRMLSYSIRETCRLLDIVPSTLRLLVQAYNRGGPEALKTKAHSGRPRKLGNDDRDFIVKQINGTLPNGEPFTAIAVHGYLKKKK